jgi:hypothetical protein
MDVLPPQSIFIGQQFFQFPQLEKNNWPYRKSLTKFITYSRPAVSLPLFKLELIYWRNTIDFVYRWILLLDI